MKRSHAGRRANGEGTRPRKRKDGRWYVDVSIPLPEGGTKRVKVYSRFSAEDCADRARRLRLEHVDAGGYREPERASVADFLAGPVGADGHRTGGWLDDVAKQRVRPKTWRSYRSVIRNHLLPSLGAVRLTQLSPPMIARALSDDAPEGARTRELAYTVLHSALETAVKWQFIPRNPAHAVEKPRVPKSELDFFRREEVLTFLSAAQIDRLFAFYLVGIFTGLRPGESAALRWREVDLDGRRITVTHTLDDATLARVEPKTPRAKRTVDVSPTVAAELRAHRKRMLAQGHAHGLVFPDTDGGPLRLSNFTRRSYKPLLADAFGLRLNGELVPDRERARALLRANAKNTKALERIAGKRPSGERHDVALVRDLRLYDLRHTAATLMIAAGIHVKVISERMGHASVAFTMDTYGHLLPTLGRDAALALEQFLAPAAETA
jgi:integrase